MNLIQLAARVPWPFVAAVLAANAIPYLAALATKRKGWWTGIIAMGLSFADGLLSTIANASSPINWRAVIAASFGAWAVAALHHSKVLSGTQLEATLHGT